MNRIVASSQPLPVKVTDGPIVANPFPDAVEDEVFLGRSFAEWYDDAHTSPILKAALKFWKHGLNVIPLNDDKVPLIKWKQWQKTRQDWEGVIALYLEREHPPALGVLTGTFGRLVVLDIDGPHGEEILRAEGFRLPRTPEVRTPRGRHLWFTVPSHVALQSRILSRTYGFDLISEGRYIVAPPSRINGFEYSWMIPVSEVSIANLPEELVRLVERLFRSPLPREGARGGHAGGGEYFKGDASIDGHSLTPLSLDTCYLDTCFSGERSPASYKRVQRGDLMNLV